MALCSHVKNNPTFHLSLCLVVLIDLLRLASTSKMSMMLLNISRMLNVNFLMRVMVKTTTLMMIKKRAISTKSLSIRRIRIWATSLPFRLRTTVTSFNLIAL